MNCLELRIREFGLQIFNDLLLDIHGIETAAHDVPDGIGHHWRKLTILFESFPDSLAHHGRVTGHDIVNRRYFQHLAGIRRCLGSTSNKKCCD